MAGLPASVLRAAKHAGMLLVTFYFPETIVTYTTALTLEAAAAWLKIHPKVLYHTEVRLSARFSPEQAELVCGADAERAAKYWERFLESG